MPLHLLVDPDKPLPLEAPIRTIEVQAGKVVAVFPDDHRVEGDAETAPTIPGEDSPLELRAQRYSGEGDAHLRSGG